MVTPGSTVLPFSAKAGDGRPQRIIDRARALFHIRITGAAMFGKMPGSGGRLPVIALDAERPADLGVRASQAVEVAHAACAPQPR